jgi:hypothetical protein
MPEVAGEPLHLQLQRQVEGGEDTLRRRQPQPHTLLRPARSRQRLLHRNKSDSRNTQHSTRGSRRRGLQEDHRGRQQRRQHQVHRRLPPGSCSQIRVGLPLRHQQPGRARLQEDRHTTRSMQGMQRLKSCTGHTREKRRRQKQPDNCTQGRK